MKIKHPIKLSLIVFILSYVSVAQVSDLARLDYTIIPSSSNVEFTRVRGLFNYPIKLNATSYVLLGLDYSNIQLSFFENNYPFDKDVINDFKLLDVNLGYIGSLKNDWIFGLRLRPGFSTNLSSSKILFEDIVLSGELVFVKEWEATADRKKQRLILGVTYSENKGFSLPLPFVSYYKQIHQKWSYTLGVPVANFKYHFSEKNTLGFLTGLEGFTANIQNGMMLDSGAVVTSINMFLIQTGVQYEYKIRNRLAFFARASYNITNTLSLRNKNNKNELDLDAESKTYFRTGLRFKI